MRTSTSNGGMSNGLLLEEHVVNRLDLTHARRSSKDLRIGMQLTASNGGILNGFLLEEPLTKFECSTNLILLEQGGAPKI